MTSIDELFKKPGLPIGSGKRKLEVPDAHEVYKSTKLSKDASPNGRQAHAASVDDDNDDMEAGPELPPDGDDAGDDEDGRFFGNGMTKESADALDYIDEQEDADLQDEKIDAAWLRRLSTSFERKITKNAELRARYENDPEKFMASEAELDAEIKTWSLLSEHSELYQDFTQSGSAASLVGLLAHENTDISIGAIEIISELLDDDVNAQPAQWDALTTALLDADLLELLMSNLNRLDEDNETDRSGVYHSLSVLEHLASQEAVAERIGQEHVLDWLCKRIAKPETSVSQNQQYTAEVLQVLLQSSPVVRKRLTADSIDGVDLFLRLIARYRKRDPPKDSHEEEFVENVFDALACVVEIAEGKAKFVQCEGVELCLLMLKDASKNFGFRSTRILDHAAGGQSVEAVEVCQKIIEAAGLKPLFATFMKTHDHDILEHLLGLFSAFLRVLPGDSAERIRVLAKFAEKDHAKVVKLLQLRKEYVQRVERTEKDLKLDQSLLGPDEEEDSEEEWYLAKLDGGLYHLQIVDTILAWLIAENADVKVKVMGALEDGVASIRASLETQCDNLDKDAAENNDTREMLDTLIEFLD
jgi:beta-catenin-like protein 1